MKQLLSGLGVSILSLSILSCTSPTGEVEAERASIPTEEAERQIPATAEYDGIWISRGEIVELPISGPAWTQLLTRANQAPGIPDVSDQNSNHDVNMLAKALVYVRTGIESYRTQVREGCMGAIDTELGGRTLALGRNLCCYVIAADLVRLDPVEDVVFKSWLRRTLTEDLSGRTLQSTHMDRPNNWGTMAGGSRAAVALYLNDVPELQETARIFKGYLGDRDSYANFRFQFGDQGADTWMPDPINNPRPLNELGARVQGQSVDGALPDDISRGGPFEWPPIHTGYPWEGLAGAVVQAEILSRQGFDTWNWENRAMYRAVDYLRYLDALFGDWWVTDDDEEWLIWVVNRAYGSSFQTELPARHGKNMGWCDWTNAE